MALLVVACLSLAVGLLASWAGTAVALGPLRKAKPAHWVERARLAFPARAVSRFALLLVPVALGIAASLASPMVDAPAALTILCAALPAFLAAFGVRLHVERVVRQRRVGAGELLRGWAGLWTVMYPHLAIAIGGMALATDAMGARSWAALGVTALGVVAAMAGGGVAIARLVGLAHPASERVRRAVDAASQATGVRARAVLEIDLMMANAFALPAARMLLFTPDLARALDEPQITAVARHELGHVSEPAGVVALRIANAMVVILAIVAARPVSGALSPDPGLTRLAFAVLVLAAAIVFARVVFRPLSRRMEERADRIAHGREHDAGGPDGAVYASALEAIYAANLVPAVMNARGAHPHLYDRMVSAGVTPAWPRPAPPSRSRLRASLAVCLAVTAVALTAVLQGMGIALAF